MRRTLCLLILPLSLMGLTSCGEKDLSSAASSIGDKVGDVASQGRETITKNLQDVVGQLDLTAWKKKAESAAGDTKSQAMDLIAKLTGQKANAMDLIEKLENATGANMAELLGKAKDLLPELKSGMEKLKSLLG